jgi:hypothetical protein
MQKIFRSFLSALILAFVLMLPALALANPSPDGPLGKLNKTAKESGFNDNAANISLPAAVGKVISMLLGLLGVIFLGLIIYAGIMWMIAAGDESKVTKSKDTMKRAIIGLIIVVGAYAISQFVVYTLAG